MSLGNTLKRLALAGALIGTMAGAKDTIVKIINGSSGTDNPQMAELLDIFNEYSQNPKLLDEAAQVTDGWEEENPEVGSAIVESIEIGLKTLVNPGESFNDLKDMAKKGSEDWNLPQPDLTVDQVLPLDTSNYSAAEAELRRQSEKSMFAANAGMEYREPTPPLMQDVLSEVNQAGARPGITTEGAPGASSNLPGQ